MSVERVEIDYWDCAGCHLVELSQQEANRHRELTDHTLIPRYV
jgi:hypothetical protein